MSLLCPNKYTYSWTLFSHFLNQIKTLFFFFAAAGASAAFHDYDHIPLTELSHVVINYVQDSLDCCHSSQLNWEQLAHLHGWNFGMINKIKLKWQKRVIESPFLELIQNSHEFQNYTYGQLKEDLEKIPRKDILEKLRDYEEKGKLLVG
mgnify:CR=1 FL=1